MPTSSLVFLVIIGVWAAYFIQYWVRRREHLATVHAADQFSESMRVLERQATGEDGARDAVRASGPQPLLKRTPSAPVALDRPAATTSVAAARTQETARPQQIARQGANRRQRGLAVVSAFAALVLAGPLAALGMVPAVTVLAAVAGLVAAIVWLRRGVAAERAAQRAARPRPERRAELQVERPIEPRAEAATGTSPAADREQESPQTLREAPRARDELYDVQLVEQSIAGIRTATQAAPATPTGEPAPARPLVDDDDIPLTWDPVPVPRPTYAMNSRVTRPAPTAADLVGDADTEYADTAYAAYEDDELVRQVAGA